MGLSDGEVCPEVYSHALQVAESLREQLEHQLVGKSQRGWSCSCGASNSKIVGVGVPSSPQLIAWCRLWTCTVVDDNGHESLDTIEKYISPTELYPMFRNRFAGLDVVTACPYVELYRDREEPDERRRFTPSGRTVVVSANSSAYVCPSGDLANSVWLNAEIRIDAYDETRPLIACNLDPFAFGYDREAGEYQELPDSSHLPTFYIHLFGDGNEVFMPIARLVAVDADTAAVTLELDSSVETVEPAVSHLGQSVKDPPMRFRDWLVLITFGLVPIAIECYLFGYLAACYIGSGGPEDKGIRIAIAAVLCAATGGAAGFVACAMAQYNRLLGAKICAAVFFGVVLLYGLLGS